ncbi:MAG: ABC transporter ATP-binding protein [Bacteroidota bacterium]
MIRIKNVKFRYPGSQLILDNINLELGAGNIYGLFGRNGEGKSTLLKLMAGLLYPKAGQCCVFEDDTSDRKVKYLQEIFIVPEEFELPGVKIALYEKVNSPFYPNFSKERFSTLLSEFKLFPNQKISNLSFGQKKKVLIAFGLAANTKLLLMDEPTNGLDIPSKSQFRKIMASSVDERKCIVISTHQIRDLYSLINHVIVLDDSKVAFDRPLSIVSENLWFGKPPRGVKEDLIYSEATFGGKAVLARQDQDESEVDLELLFNAVLNEPERINRTLNRISHEPTI